MSEIKHIDVGAISIEVLIVNNLIESFDSVLKTENTGPGLHYHTKMDEIFYIMEGKVEVTKGDEKIIATPGSLVRIPKLTHHGFHSIIGPARLLVTFIPGGGQVQYLYELGELMKSGSSWREGIGALQEKYDVHPL
jgi:mannose-6-phosphate isomerase-like protein (cupin superfamily)